MKYLDPSRPLSTAGHPMYVSPGGKAIGILPALEVRPIGLGYRVAVWLLVGNVTGREHSMTIPMDSLPALLADFTNDTEAALAAWFHYDASWKDKQFVLQVTKPILALEDLGL